jgi:hypothetical protein
VCALASIAVMHYGHYWNFQRQLSAKLSSSVDPSKFTPEKRRDFDKLMKSIADQLLIAKTGHAGFAGFMIIRAQEGETISSTHGGMSKDSGIHITGIGMWILWTAEALIVIGVSMTFVRKQAKAPFCEECGTWFDKPAHALHVPTAAADQLRDAVATADANRIGALHGFKDLDPTTGSGVARVYTCPDCKQTLADVQLRTPGQKGKFDEKPLLPPTAIHAEALEAMRAPRPPAAGAAVAAASPAPAPSPQG